MVSVKIPDSYPEDRLEVTEATGTNGVPLVCVLAYEHRVDSGPQAAHVHAERASLLEALGAMDADQSTLQALLETRTAERDAAQGNALESERKHGEVVGQLGRVQEQNDRLVQENADQRNAIRELRDLLNDTNAALVDTAHWGGSVSDIPRRVRRIAEQREAFQQDYMKVHAALLSIARVSGYPGSEGDAVEGLPEFIDSQLKNLGRRASDAEEALAAQAADRSMTGELLIQWDGQQVPVSVYPTTWSAVVPAEDGQGRGRVIGEAIQRADGTWGLQCLIYGAEPFPHQGRVYSARADVSLTQVRDRLGAIVAVATSHRESDEEFRRDAMATMERIARGSDGGEG